MHLHLFMICVHVFVKVEITRSEVAAQTIQFAESFSWTRTKWKNSSVCGSGVEPEKLWPSCNPLGAHQNDGRDENMFQFRWLPNPSLLEKINTQQTHGYTTGLVLDLFRWQWVTRGMWLVQVWHRENSSPSSFQCSCASGRAKRLLSRVWPRHWLSTRFMLPKYHRHHHHILKSTCLIQIAPGAPQILQVQIAQTTKSLQFPWLYHVVWCCIPYWLWIFTQVSVVRHVTLKHGFSDRSFRTYHLWAQTGGHGEGDGLVGSTWGFSSWGCHSVALAVVTWPCPAVCIPKWTVYRFVQFVLYHSVSIFGLFILA